MYLLVYCIAMLHKLFIFGLITSLKIVFFLLFILNEGSSRLLNVKARL